MSGEGITTGLGSILEGGQTVSASDEVERLRQGQRVRLTKGKEMTCAFMKGYIRRHYSARKFLAVAAMTTGEPERRA